MILRQTLHNAINGYWDGGPKNVFDWSIDGPPCSDNKGSYVRIGSWSANNWFHVAVGKTDKLTLSNARRRLQVGVKRSGLTCTFEYID
jgi:hypothetical protein